MMINKRLIGTVSESKKYIAGNVALQWLSLAANIGMTWKTKIRIMITVTLLMSIGFVMMHQVPVGRIVLACVWVFHVLYFLFGGRTFRPEEAAE